MGSVLDERKTCSNGQEQQSLGNHAAGEMVNPARVFACLPTIACAEQMVVLDNAPIVPKSTHQHSRRDVTCVLCATGYENGQAGAIAKPAVIP